MARRLDKDVLPPSLRITGELPPAFERVVLRALDREPAARFASASELAEALAAAIAEAAVEAAVEPALVAAPIDRAFSTEAPTGRWPRRLPDEQAPRFASGTRSGEHPSSGLRRSIRDAIAANDCTAITSAYLELARYLVDEHRLAPAIAEIEEAIWLLASPEPGANAESLWRLELSLAALYAGTGALDNARRVAVSGLEHAALVDSYAGQARARMLLKRL